MRKLHLTCVDTIRVRRSMIDALLLLFVALGLGLSVTASANGQDSLSAARKDFRETYQPFLKKYCSECHFGATAKAGINLETDSSIDAIMLHREAWQTVQHVLADEEMPPDEAPQPSAAERESFAKWLDYLINTLRCSAQANPGTATLRRLNRTEYRNTILDLVCIDYPPAEQFPGDDVGYGFDNIGDLLSVPPILLEKYMAAAEQIAAQAIVETSSLKTDRRFLGNDLDACDGAYPGGQMMVVAKNGTVATVTTLPVGGKYTVEVVATAHQAGNEPAKMEIVVGGKSVGSFEITKPFGQNETNSVEVDLPAGEISLGAAFTNDFVDKNDERPVGTDRNLLIDSIRIKGPSQIDVSSLPSSHRRLITVTADESRSEHGAARQLIPVWARRAFRRPPTEEETDRLMSLFDIAKSDGATFEQSMRLVLEALLVSPHFLFKVEQPLAADGSIRELNDFELATSLSYFLWSTMPDDELSSLADQGRLSDPIVFKQQVQRMLDHPKAQNLVDNFARQWLQLRLLSGSTPNPDRFPEFDESLRTDMAKETLLCVQRILEHNESILRLLDDNHTYLNGRLAAHYGVPGVDGEDFQWVDVGQIHRGGILTQASILTLTSYPARTSPVKRGKWIMENLLGETPPPPDPAAMPLDEQHELVGTLRQRMEQHRKNPNCAACHERMDALGFALENYDPVGKWREQDEGQPIDSLGAFSDGTEFHGARELQETLSGNQREQFVRCFTEKLMTFALGRGLEYQDECVVDDIMREASQDGYRIRTIIREIAESDPFMKRQRRGGE